MSGELFHLLEKYRKSSSEDPLKQIEEKLKAAAVPEVQIKTQLADLAASCETKTIDIINEEALTSEILGWQANAEIEKCNLAVYRAIAPFAKLMYAVEQNGVAIEHAYKLAVLFDDEKKAFAYLSSFIKSNPTVKHPFHDACLFSLPTGHFDLTIWRKLCSKHMNEQIFRHKILPRADVLEAFIKSHQKGKKVNFKAIAEQRKIIEKINAERKKLKRKHGTLTIPEKERLTSLSQQLIAAQKALVTLAPPFNHDLQLTTLQAFLKIKDVESVGTLKYFLEHGLTEKDYAKFIALERKDDATQIPNIVINGDEIGHPGFYLMKVDVMDDMQAARAACLGKLSNCCQSLSGEAGESCTIHGLTSPLGGFYVVCKGDVNNPLVTDPLEGQCWAWRSQSGAMVFDSIETPQVISMAIDSIKRVARFYQALAVKLVDNNHTNIVACGATSGISRYVGTKSVFNTKESFVDYAGYCDSSEQKVIADKERPYYDYEIDEQRTHETEEIITKFVSEDVVSQQSFEMLNWALLFNQSLTTKIEEELQAKLELEKLAILKKMATLVNNTNWDKETIEDVAEESIKNSLFTSIRNHQNMTPLMMASANGYLDLVNTLLINNADVNARNEDDSTPLLLAASRGYHEVVKSLLNNGADVNVKDKRGNTPLLLAVKNGELNVINALLANKADIHAKNSSGDTPLHMVAHLGNLDIITALLANHADVNAKNNFSNTPLHLMASVGKLDLVNTLLANHADVNAKNNSGDTPLHMAAYSGKLNVVYPLLANKADVNAKNNSGDTPLTLAATKKHFDVVNALIANKADMHTKNNFGNTLSLLAAKIGQFDTVNLLLANHADVNAKDMDGLTLLMFAVIHGEFNVVNTLLAKKADINAKDKNGDTPLHLAASLGKLDLVNTLLANHADMNAKNVDGNTPLMLAVLNDKLDVIKPLLANNADVNAKNVHGNTPLMLAVLNDKLDVIKTLLANNADVHAKDVDGNTPLMLAVLNDKLNLIDTLLANRADVNTKNDSGDAPLHPAAYDGKLIFVNTLLANNADVNVKDIDDNTPLMLAVLNDQLDVIKTLLANNADVYAKNMNGYTALQLAEQNGRNKITEVLRAKMNDLSQNKMNSSSAKPKPMAYSFQKENATHSSDIDKETDKSENVVQQKPTI